MVQCILKDCIKIDTFSPNIKIFITSKLAFEIISNIRIYVITKKIQ